MITRRTLLAGSAGLLAAPVLARSFNAQSSAVKSIGGLRAHATAKGLIYGSATANYELKDADFTAALTTEAAMLVPEYEMKRNLVEPERGRFDFSAGDALIGFARDNALGFRGHPLVWYAANPPWLEQTVLETRDERLLTDYIAVMAGRYRGRMHSWDVVNEAILPKDGRPDAMRNSFWLAAFGPAYVDLAFHAAREADPHALLVYNDWGFEGGEAWNDDFRTATLIFLDGLLKRGVPVDGLGFQGHMSAFGPKLNQRALRDFMDEIKARGLRILVTEHDVEDSGGPSDFGARDAAVADASARFLDVVLENDAVETVLTWGLCDRYLDPPDDWRLRLAGWHNRKLPLDSAMQRKPMWDAMARAFSGRATPS